MRSLFIFAFLGLIAISFAATKHSRQRLVKRGLQVSRALQANCQSAAEECIISFLITEIDISASEEEILSAVCDAARTMSTCLQAAVAPCPADPEVQAAIQELEQELNQTC
jgi:hypothetical protein